MHFIFLTLGYYPDQVGGACRYVTEVAERLAARKHRVDVVYPAAGLASGGRESRTGVSLFRYRNPRGFFWLNWRRENATVRRLWQAAAGAATGSVLTASCHAYFAPAFNASRGRRIFLFTGPWAEEHRFTCQSRRRSWPQRWLDEWVVAILRRQERRALRQAGRILTISRYYETQLPHWHGTALPPVQVISGGVNPNHFRPVDDRAVVRAKFGLAPGQCLFLTVRRLDARMGLLTLIEGFGRIAALFPHAQLWIAGTGPQRDALCEQIARHGLDGRVKLLGLVPEADLALLFNAADCVVVPSLDLEGFGLVTVEALACGTPVVGSRAGATPELLGPLSEGLLFEAGSAAAAAAKLEQVLREPHGLPTRERCRDYAVKHFSWDRVATAFEAAYTDLDRAGGRA
jgi:glycosyltransferase involved in cell wall biosynthesis